MRCFVAVAAGAAVAERIAEELPRLRAAAERAGLKVTWSRPDGWHVTLKFLGEIDESQVGRVRRRLAEIIPRHEAFSIETTGLETLPPGSRKPSVLAVMIAQGEQGEQGRLSELAAAVDQALAPLGFEREQRAFRAHLTVGRVRDARGWRALEPAIASLRNGSFGRSVVRKVSLYRSRLGDGPARYEALDTFVLGAASRDTQAEDPSRRKGRCPSS